MKLIKKIAAIMFAFIMVVSMSCNVKADDTTTTTETGEGKIIINNAIPGQTYKLYRLLDLESYSVNEDGQKENGNYSYKPTSKWKTFLEGDGINNVYFTFENGYALWKKGANVETFAKLAIEHANKENAVIKAEKTEVASAAIEGNNTTTVTFGNLPLGYYLVDSSVGTLCSLDTTNKDATIREKNDVPSVVKRVHNKTANENGWNQRNFAQIGDTIEFKTTITTKAGAQNYILHDKLDNGFTLNQNSIKVMNNSTVLTDEDYTLSFNNALGTDIINQKECTFHIVFSDTYCSTVSPNTEIEVTYDAIMNENAFVGHRENGTGNRNVTWLGYGDGQNTVESITNTFTYEVPVFKFTNKDSKEVGLADAEFTLSTDQNGDKRISFVKMDTRDGYDIYRVALAGENNTSDVIKTTSAGKFKMVGLSGTYYLTEIKAPNGYNKLSAPYTVYVSDLNGIQVNGTINTGDVKVLNKTGTVLPSTGGAGTTMIYLVGAVLVLGSGVILVTKRRVKGK